MTGEEEKGKGRVLNLDEIPGEGKTLDDIIESGEIPEELRESIEALAKTSKQAFAKTLQPFVSEAYQTMMESVRNISAGRFTWADVVDMVDGQDEVVSILEKLLEAGRARDRRILILTAIGWGILIILNVISWGIALDIVQWPRGG